MTRRPFACLIALIVMSYSAGVWAQSPVAAPQSANPTSKPGVTIQLGGPAAQASAGRSANPADEPAALAMADHLMAMGKIAEAQTKYQEIANLHPGSVPAQVGVIRTLILQRKLDEAQSTVDTVLALHPDSPEVLLGLGDLQFAQGRIAEAERSYVKAENLKPNDPLAYIGLEHVYRAASLYRRAYDNIKRAHELAPNDLAVQLLWFNSLPPQDRVPALQLYLSNPGLNPQMVKVLQQYLAFLKKNADAPVHPCNIVSKTRNTDTKLYPITRAGSALGASGLVVKINNQETHLALDTGASGVVLGRTSAEKLGLQRLGYQPIVGLGDSGQQGGYTAVANRIRVGDLEFSDCTVRVTEAADPVTGQDGLIGADVFSSYLVDLDIPGAKLRLSPLPKRPDQAAAPTALQTMSRDGQALEAEGPANSATRKPGADEVLNVPMDAYVAPEMADWTKVYRFGNMLMVPTKVDGVGPMLFLIDTGSFNNVLSTSTAQELTKLRSDPGTRITGLSGAVAKVYRADKATLQFGRYEQQNQDVVTFDLSNISRQTGTQVSGILGFNMLRILQVRIDYRDGLVDFLYNPNRLPKQIKLNK